MPRRSKEYWDIVNEALDKAIAIKITGHFDYQPMSWFFKHTRMPRSIELVIRDYAPMSSQCMANGLREKILYFRSLFKS